MAWIEFTIERVQPTKPKTQMAQLNPGNIAIWEPKLEKMTPFGRAHEEGYSFEWPTAFQLKHWDTTRKIQLQRISTHWTPLRAVQFHFTGDISSEHFDSGCRSEPDIAKEFMLNVVPPPGESKSVPIVEVSCKMTAEMHIYGLRIKYATGDVYIPFESDKGTWKTKPIPEDREIVGLFGDLDAAGERITCLGFILWQPNPAAI